MSDATPDQAEPVDFNRLLGVDVDVAEVADGKVRGTLAVRPQLLQPFGIVHGGVYASLAETMASVATWLNVQADGMNAMGQSNNTSFLRPATEGTITAEGRAIHRGRTSWVWDIDCFNDAGKLCATSRVTIAVRPAPAAA